MSRLTDALFILTAISTLFFLGALGQQTSLPLGEVDLALPVFGVSTLVLLILLILSFLIEKRRTNTCRQCHLRAPQHKLGCSYRVD